MIRLMLSSEHRQGGLVRYGIKITPQAFANFSPGLSLRLQPGLTLANVFGVNLI